MVIDCGSGSMVGRQMTVELFTQGSWNHEWPKSVNPCCRGWPVGSLTRKRTFMPALAVKIGVCIGLLTERNTCVWFTSLTSLITSEKVDGFVSVICGRNPRRAQIG